MTYTLRITVDDSDFQDDLEGAEKVIEQLVDAVAEDLAENLAREGGRSSSRLGKPWKIDGAGSSRTVTAPEFFAHWIAGGTAAHGPRTSPFILFRPFGNWVRTRNVEGSPGTHFDVAAMSDTESNVPEIFARALQEEID